MCLERAQLPVMPRRLWARSAHASRSSYETETMDLGLSDYGVIEVGKQPPIQLVGVRID
jgi:hypothetical protein